MFLIAGNSIRLSLQPNEGLVVTADAPAIVRDFSTNAVLAGINKSGKDTRALFYGPFSTAMEALVTSSVDSDVEVHRGSIVVHGNLELVTLQAGELATPTPEILSTTLVTYRLDVPPYTRWRSDGVRLVQEIDAVLTGYALGPATPVLSTDTLFEAIGKLQAQINAGGGGGSSNRMTDHLSNRMTDHLGNLIAHA